MMMIIEGIIVGVIEEELIQAISPFSSASFKKLYQSLSQLVESSSYKKEDPTAAQQVRSAFVSLSFVFLNSWLLFCSGFSLAIQFNSSRCF